MALRIITIRAAIAVTLSLAALGGADAGSLEVSPVTLTRVAPVQAGALSLSNAGSTPIDAQVRVLRWHQVNGQDALEATGDVVASPPMLRLMPGRPQTVRIVRVSAEPIVGEESYRVLVDELPTRGKTPGDTVRLVIRYSLPVFFQAAGATRARVSWRIRYQHGVFSLVAENQGATRSQVAAVEVVDAEGTVFRLSDGLAGYVLGGKTATWSFPSRTGRPPKEGPGFLRYQTDGTPVDVPIRLQVGR